MRDPLAQNDPAMVEQPSSTLQTRRDGLSEHWAGRPACVHTSGGASKNGRRARFESSEGSSAHQKCSDARVRFEALIVTRANGTAASRQHLQRHGALSARLIRRPIFQWGAHSGPAISGFRPLSSSIIIMVPLMLQSEGCCRGL
eukprot:2695920-Prymnesium_polylepis.3